MASQQPTAHQPGQHNLSTKDLNYLKDMLSWELLAMKKYHHYAGECSQEAADQGFKDLLVQLSDRHRQRYDQLLHYVQGAVGQSFSMSSTQVGQQKDQPAQYAQQAQQQLQQVQGTPGQF